MVAAGETGSGKGVRTGVNRISPIPTTPNTDRGSSEVIIPTVMELGQYNLSSQGNIWRGHDRIEWSTNRAEYNIK